MRSRRRQTTISAGASTAALAPTRRWVFRLVSAAGATILALAVGETLVRIFEVGPDIYPLRGQVFTLSDNPKLLFELVPGAVSTEEDLTINADGMRDRDYSVTKPPHTYRIACIGDSICFGWPLKQSEPCPKRLEALLNRYLATPDRRFEVLNFGVSGYNISQIVESLRVRALKYQPDLVIYGYCLNDPLQFSLTYESLRAQLTAAEKNFRDRLVGSAYRLRLRSRLYLLAWYLSESMTLQGHELEFRRPPQQWLIRQKKDYHGWVADLYRDGPWRHTVDELSVLARMTRPPEIATYVVIFPFFENLSDYRLTEVHRRIAAASDRLSLGVIDLLDDYQALERASPEPFALDITHPNPRGHTFAAVAILRELVLRGAIPASADCLADLASAPGPVGEFWHLLLGTRGLPGTDPGATGRPPQGP